MDARPPKEIRFAAYSHLDWTAAAAFAVLSLTGLGMGIYSLTRGGDLVGLLPLAFGTWMMIALVVSFIRRRSPIASVEITADCIEWRQSGKATRLEWRGLTEIHYSTSDPSSFTFSWVGRDAVTIISDLNPGQEMELFEFLGREFRGRLLHNGTEWRGLL